MFILNKYDIIVTQIKKLWRNVFVNHSNHKMKRKEFHDALCRRELLRRTKHNRRNKPHKRTHSVEETKSYTGRRVLTAPAHLDLFSQTQDTLDYFNEVIDTVSRCRMGDTIFFDLSEVQIISPDAIMYMTAVIKNMKRIRGLRINCAGNLPKNSSAKEMIQQSGFFKFVSSANIQKVESDERYMKISHGQDANGELASSFCDFVHRVCNMSNRETKRLYPMIIELMTNTHQHAYDADERQIMMEKWYIFAQDTEKAVHFVFLDTGIGIPSTVAKRALEKIRDWIRANDAAYLKSALQGDFRSETRQEHRGKGLPGIYEDACNAAIENLSIISGRGKCTVVEDKTIQTESLHQAFEGTLFVWDVLKKEKLA